MGLASEGYELSYRRIPLSRERTPEAADLDTLHSQLLQQPPGTLTVDTDSTTAFDLSPDRIAPDPDPDRASDPSPHLERDLRPFPRLLTLMPAWTFTTKGTGP
jgi:hypothetical protein